MSESVWIFIGLVFVAVVFLVQGLTIPVFGEAKATRRRLKLRLKQIEQPKRRCYWHYASARWDDLRLNFSDFPWNDSCFRNRAPPPPPPPL